MQALLASIQNFSGKLKTHVADGDAAAVAEIDRLVEELRMQIDAETVEMGVAVGGDIGVAITTRHLPLGDDNLIDCALANHFSKTVLGDVSFSVTNVPVADRTVTIVLHLTDAGSGNVSFWDNITWLSGAPVFKVAGRDSVLLTTFDSGSTWLAYQFAAFPVLSSAIDSDSEQTVATSNAVRRVAEERLNKAGDKMDGVLAVQRMLDRTRVETLTSTKSVPLDLDKYSVFQWTLLGGNLSLTVPGSLPTGEWDSWMADDQFSKVSHSIVVRIVMGDTLRTVTWWPNITWLTRGGVAPEVPPVNKMKEYVFTTIDGVNWIGREGPSNA